MANNPLAQETVWIDKAKCEDAERHFHEHLAKPLANPSSNEQQEQPPPSALPLQQDTYPEQLVVGMQPQAPVQQPPPQLTDFGPKSPVSSAPLSPLVPIAPVPEPQAPLAPIPLPQSPLAPIPLPQSPLAPIPLPQSPLAPTPLPQSPLAPTPLPQSPLSEIPQSQPQAPPAPILLPQSPLSEVPQLQPSLSAVTPQQQEKSEPSTDIPKQENLAGNEEKIVAEELQKPEGILPVTPKESDVKPAAPEQAESKPSQTSVPPDSKKQPRNASGKPQDAAVNNAKQPEKVSVGDEKQPAKTSNKTQEKSTSGDDKQQNKTVGKTQDKTATKKDKGKTKPTKQQDDEGKVHLPEEGEAKSQKQQQPKHQDTDKAQQSKKKQKNEAEGKKQQPSSKPSQVNAKPAKEGAEDVAAPASIAHENKKEVKQNQNKKKQAQKQANAGGPTAGKTSLTDEIARARQHITNSLQSSVDSLPKGSKGDNSELSTRLHKVEDENKKLNKAVDELHKVVAKLEARIGKLESSSKPKPATPKPVPAKGTIPAEKQTNEEEEDIDLFGSDDENDAEKERLCQERLKAYEEKKSKKPALIAKSNVILDVKVWDDEADMKEVEKVVRHIETDGLVWGASKLVPLAYGINKLQISCVVEDDKVSVDWLQEQIESNQELVQSVDIAAFNKV